MSRFSAAETLTITVDVGDSNNPRIDCEVTPPELQAIGLVTVQWAHLEQALLVRTGVISKAAGQPLPHSSPPSRHQQPMNETTGGIRAAQAAAYVRGRRDYPVALEEWLRDDLGLGEGKTAIDLGAGTGKFVPRLLAVGAEVIAIEPSVAMRSQLEALFPQVDSREGTAQAMPLADESVDAVIRALRQLDCEIASCGACPGDRSRPGSHRPYA